MRKHYFFQRLRRCHKCFGTTKIWVLGDSRDSPVGCEDEEEKLLKQAIALSLEGTKENDKEEKNNDE